MKKRKAVLVFGISIVLLMSGCSGSEIDKDNDKVQSSENIQSSPEMENGIFGQVTEVGEDYIIIEKTGEKQEAEGDKQEIKVDADTAIKRGGGRMPGKGKPEGEEPPQTGEDQQPDAKAPQQPEGEEPPQRPEGGQSQKQDEDEKLQKPDGEQPDGEIEEEIVISDISVGDRVSVILGDDGAADEIRVMQEDAPEQEQGNDEKESI